MSEILLVDDDPVLNFISKKMVESEFPDLPIVIFENGEKAYSYIKNTPEKIT